MVLIYLLTSEVCRFFNFFINALNFNIDGMMAFILSGQSFLKAAEDGNAAKLAEIMTDNPAIKNYKNGDVS